MPTECPKCHAENPADSSFCRKCATRLDGSGAAPSFTKTLETPGPALGRGTIFASRFEIIEELGAGGMGQVFRAYDKEVGEEVALKLLHPEIALSKRTVDRFRNEIKLARKITHRNVCRMHELHQDGQTLFITMEYVTGQDLKGLIKQTGALTTGKTISIGRQVAEGLAEAHSLGVIHRDLKPQNIMVDKDGNAKVMDFGIARSLAGAGMTAEGSLIGTPDYMSPEQVEGKEADQRSDLYSLGVILFEMATGRPPFEGDTPLSVAFKHKNEIPIAPRKLNTQVPEPLNKVILRCLEKDKADRYQTAEELLSDLALVEEGLPITERVTTKTRTTLQRSALKPSGWRRFSVPALAGAGVIAAALVLWLVLPRGKAPSPASSSDKPSIAVLKFENISGDPALDYLKEGLTKLLSMGLSESKLLRVLDENSTYGILKKHKLDDTSKYTREDLVKIADEGGVGYTASGSLMKAGQSIIIMLTLQNPRANEAVSPIKATCQNEGELLSRTKELVAKIQTGMNLSPDRFSADAGQVLEKLTSSPEALKYWLESWPRYVKGEIAEGIALCEKAIELDPNFANAYLNLASGYQQLGNSAKGSEFRKKAFELRDRAPQSERLFIEGYYYIYLPGEDSQAKAREAFEKYLEFFPNDYSALQPLAMIYKRSGDRTKYLEYSERAYRADPAPYSLELVLSAYQQTSKLDRGEKTLEEYFESNREDNPVLRMRTCRFYTVRKNFKRALAEIERGFLQAPSPETWSWDNLRGDVYQAQGDLAAAEKEYLRVIQKAERPKYVSDATYNLVGLYLLEGKMRRAGDELAKAIAPGGAMQGTSVWSVAFVWIRLGQYDKALEIYETQLKNASERDDPDLKFSALWNKGFAYIEKKDIGAAEKIAEELRSLGQKNTSTSYAMVPYATIQGRIDLEKGDYAKAFDNLKRWLADSDSEMFSGVQPGYHIYVLALAYYKSANLPKAREEFEKLTNLTAGRWNIGDLYAKSYYWLGKIAEQQKDKARARRNYAKFLDIWKDADPGQPEVDDARARVEALR